MENQTIAFIIGNGTRENKSKRTWRETEKNKKKPDQTHPEGAH